MYFRLVDIYLKDREGSALESYDSFYKTVLELCGGLGFRIGNPGMRQERRDKIAWRKLTDVDCGWRLQGPGHFQQH